MTFKIESYRDLIAGEVFDAIESQQSLLTGTLIVHKTNSDRASMSSIETGEYGLLHIMQINRSPSDKDFGLTYLHELIHAVLFEECPEVFFCPDLSQIHDNDLLLDAIRTAADWIADARMLDMCPRAALAEWMVHIEDLNVVVEGYRVGNKTMSPSLQNTLALTIAQAERLRMQVSITEEHNLRPLIDELLRINPLSSPDKSSFVSLVNFIIAFHGEMRRFDIDDNYCWVEILGE